MFRSPVSLPFSMGYETVLLKTMSRSASHHRRRLPPAQQIEPTTLEPPDPPDPPDPPSSPSSSSPFSPPPSSLVSPSSMLPPLDPWWFPHDLVVESPFSSYDLVVLGPLLAGETPQSLPVIDVSSSRSCSNLDMAHQPSVASTYPHLFFSKSYDLPPSSRRERSFSLSSQRGESTFADRVFLCGCCLRRRTLHRTKSRSPFLGSKNLQNGPGPSFFLLSFSPTVRQNFVLFSYPKFKPVGRCFIHQNQNEKSRP